MELGKRVFRMNSLSLRVCILISLGKVRVSQLCRTRVYPICVGPRRLLLR
jgi:hypothetical protein